MKLLKHLLSLIPWFWIGILSLFLFSLGLRFWGLTRFNQLVFDEIYFAKFAQNYLTSTPLFDAQPPLGKYFIALGIWLNTHIPFGDQTLKNSLLGTPLSPFSYRWMTAFMGSLIPLAMTGLVYQLSSRKIYALIAGFFTAWDGLLLVESRYSLINIYLVIFGLLGQWLFFIALDKTKGRWLVFLGSGVCLGASVAVKWNGLGFLLGLYLMWGFVWGMRMITQIFKIPDSFSKSPRIIFTKLTQINILQVLLYLGIIPLIIYILAWIPHLQTNSGGFWGLHQQILHYHENLGNSRDVHPYCSSWWTWFLMIRPMAYFYEKVPHSNLIYDVHAMGNPVLWWLGAIAIAVLCCILIQDFLEGQYQLTGRLWVALFIVFNFAANWLPWAKVNRCLFIYHYMSASVYTFMAIALLVDCWLHSSKRQYRRIGTGIIALIVIAFIFWLPVYLGLPLSPFSLRLRMWFPSWV